jgi:hypothetical protein
MDLKHLKPLINNGTITVFGDIFQHVTVDEVAEAMGCGKKQVEAIRRDSRVMTLGQLYGLSEAVGLEWRKMAKIFVE